MTAKGLSRQGQNVREKFFLDFASVTAKSSDPYRDQRKTETVTWLPELLFIDVEQSADDVDRAPFIAPAFQVENLYQAR